MTAVVFENPTGLEARLRAAPWPVAVEAEPELVPELEPATAVDVEPWEVHSELVLVCPAVRKRAFELLPERDPEAFLARPREPVSISPAEAEIVAGLPAAVLGYTLWRLAETARTAFIAVGAVIALALLAELPH